MSYYIFMSTGVCIHILEYILLLDMPVAVLAFIENNCRYCENMGNYHRKLKQRKIIEH